MDQPSLMRSVTIGRRILDVIDDTFAVRREKGNLKFIKHEMLPPLTASFRQNRAIREVHRLHQILMKEMEKCDRDDVERQNVLDAVAKKCESLKAAFENSEGAVIQLQKQKDTHKQVMDNITEEIKSSTREIRRYVKAAENLVAIRDIMQEIIKENTCYLNFLEQVANESKRFKSAREITSRYEKLMAVKKILTERLDEALVKMEDTKRSVLMYNFQANNEQHYALQRLQAVDYELNQVKSKTIKYEMALNNISIEALQQMRTLNLVLKSAEQMIENLIKEKVISKKYRKKTLAQQFEVVRKDYIKKKAVLREYQRSMDKLKLKKTNRVKVFDDYETTLVQKLMSQKRMDDLVRKKKILVWKKSEAEYLKKMRRLRGSRLFEDSDEEFDPTKDAGALYFEDEPKQIYPVGKQSKIDSDDDWEDEEDADAGFDDLHKFGSDEESFASLLKEDGSKVDFMAYAPSQKDVALDVSSTVSSITSNPLSNREGSSSLTNAQRLEKVKFTH